MEPPADAELMDSWQIYYRVAQKLGLSLVAPDIFEPDPNNGPLLDMKNEPTNDELLELLSQCSAVPLAEVKQHPNGKVFDQASFGRLSNHGIPTVRIISSWQIPTLWSS